jgi:EAL domain-containing protein (putative c-di-GMP-specific phosphodiesterase class I)
VRVFFCQCKVILALGKTPGSSIVSEEVETLGQYDFLKAHHCDTFQGYLFGQADATLTAESTQASALYLGATTRW